MWFPLAFPGIVFGFLHLFYCLPCGLQGVPVANSYPVWSYVMIIDWYHHLLTVQHTFMLISALFLLVLWNVTSTSEMALFGSVNLGHGTDACLHYTLNDIMLQMTQVFIFTFVVQWRLVLLWKCWAFYEFFMNFLWTLMSFCDIYWTLWNHVMHVGLSWMTIELQWVIVH